MALRPRKDKARRKYVERPIYAKGKPYFHLRSESEYGILIRGSVFKIRPPKRKDASKSPINDNSRTADQNPSCKGLKFIPGLCRIQWCHRHPSPIHRLRFRRRKRTTTRAITQTSITLEPLSKSHRVRGSNDSPASGKHSYAIAKPIGATVLVSDAQNRLIRHESRGAPPTQLQRCWSHRRTVQLRTPARKEVPGAGTTACPIR